MKQDRLISILLMLLNNEIVSAKDMAERFEVSIRTIYRDIEAISAAGIPIVAFQGAGGGFGIMQGYKLDKSFLTPKDAQMLEGLLNGITSVFNDNGIMDIMYKLRGIYNIKDLQTVVFDLNEWMADKEKTDVLNRIKSAAENQQLMDITYVNWNGDCVNRKIEPQFLLLKAGCWYLYAYCRKREAFRLFKVNRIVKMVVLGCRFEKRENVLENFNLDLDTDNSNIRFIDVKLHFSKKAAGKAMDYFYRDKLSFNQDGSLDVSFKSPEEDEWLYGVILSFGDQASVIEPPDLREKIIDMANKIINLYEKNKPLDKHDI